MRNRAGRSLLLVCLITGCGNIAAWGQGYPPEEAAARMTVADGFAVGLAAAEPLVRQPVAIDFDDQGRLWVMQYLQYPNPAGLERVAVDRYSRTTYDRVPEPPPHGPVGADRLTILEDTDGDGRADRAKDFMTGLNLATGFAFGYGGVFVLQAPYLLFYPDRDRNDVPDADPEVLLKGFGMEDSSSLANSLVWGPDGWLYGTQGTNIMAHIRGVEFEQGLWRYHPVTHEFELFAEGGSNMWGLGFDARGELFAGTNYGGYIVFHGVQGAYYQKSFEKHGELHNPFAFGYFKHVPHKNFQGGHVTVGGFVYQGDAFPPEFRGTYVATDTLGHAVRWHTLHRDGSTFRSANGGVLLTANDNWFAPSDAVMGPDGAVYIADWYDQRTAHPDPDAEWDRRNGRIFRLRWKDAPVTPHVDPQSRSNKELLSWLGSRNGWKAARARRVIAERSDPGVVSNLKEMLAATDDEQLTLQTLWTLHTLGAFDESLAATLLDHNSEAVRSWAIRLQGDERQVSDTFGQRLLEVAAQDASPVVIAQLASTAGRLPARLSVPLAWAIAGRSEFADDPHIPLLVWWTVEKHATDAVGPIVETFSTAAAWDTPIVRDVLLGRLMRRYAGEGSRAGYQACARLFTSAPNDKERRRLMEELDAGLKMLGRKRLPGLPPGSSFADIAVVRADRTPKPARLESMPPELAGILANQGENETTDPLLLRLATRLGSADAYARTIELATDPTEPQSVRLSALEILRELADATGIERLLGLIGTDEEPDVQTAALRVLGRFADERITGHLLQVYPQLNAELKALARDVLLGRPDSALAFLREVDRGKYPPQEVTVDQLRRVALHNNDDVNGLVRKHWGEIRPGTPEEKLAEIRRIQNDLRAAPGHAASGRRVFEKQCATCHKLYGEGKEIGPDLTKANRSDLSFLLVSMVDPSAQIRKEYLSYTVITTDGRIVTGLLIAQTAADVTLVTAKNERTTVPRDDIEQMQPMGVSLMPENILKPLQPQELRDLFAYLQSDPR